MPLPVRQAIPRWGASRTRHRPIVPIHILAPLTVPPIDACIDSAADDTVFPPLWAIRLGVDPVSAPKGRAVLIGGTTVNVIYAPVTLLLSDGYESCQWDAVVAFSTVPMRWALLGHAGFLDFFDVQLFGVRREVIVLPNRAFPGKHIIHTAAGP